ncbi:MAG TPA: phospholipase A, partial [Burkholderiales bacterium]|nr:phospholipase A [Burkholderiales bacterium]
MSAASPDLGACAAIADDARRLQCYDALAGRASRESAVPAVSSTDKPPEGLSASPRRGYSSPLRDIWDIDNDREYQIAAHKPNYVLLRQGFAPNEEPFREANEFGGSDLHFYHNELKYQLSLKSRIGKDRLLGGHVWLAYTQQSLWQMWNASISRPFRDTNYEPEVMWTFPLGYADKPNEWAPRVLTLGAVHQSNGRGGTLSRSWNRIYAQLGADNGHNMAVLVRPWWRIPARH